MNTLEIQEIIAKITLTLDNPKSVKLQIKQINLAQKQLRAIKKEIKRQKFAILINKQAKLILIV